MDILKEMLDDDGFTISPSAVQAQRTAKSMLIWCSDPTNKQTLDAFSHMLKSRLDVAIADGAGSVHSRCKMWGKYHTIRTNKDYHSLWSTFVKELQLDASPIFYQHVTERLFHHLIKIHFPAGETSTGSQLDNLSYEELNAVRYAAGYVCRSVYKKINAKSEADNEELLLSLEELLDDPDSVGDSTRDWTTLSSRGGLVQVTDDAFEVFRAIEEVVRGHFQKDRAKEISGGLKEVICAEVVCDEEVRRKWDVVAEDMIDKVGRELLEMIVDLWVTIRGFSFAGAWVELYKQKTKKTLQRSMGLRKGLYNEK